MNIIINKEISKKTFVIITIFAIISGLAMIYIATRGFINVNILKNSKKEIAEINYSEIVKTEEDENNNYQYEREVGYTYLVDGQQYEGNGRLWWKMFSSDINAKVGDKIEVFYNINNPSQSEIYHISYTLIIVGIFGFIVVPVLGLRQRMKED